MKNIDTKIEANDFENDAANVIDKTSLDYLKLGVVMKLH